MSDKRIHWNPEKKAAAVTAYIALGNSELVEAITKIPAGTIRAWRRMEWWKELEGVLREEEHSTLDSKLRKVVEKSLELVMDRLENGDFVFDQKTSQCIRRPVNLKDVHKVSTETIDRREILKKFSVKAINKPSLENHIKELAAQFEQFTKSLRRPREVDVIDVEVITDAEKTRLQIGVPELSRNTGTDQKALTAQPSPSGDGAHVGETSQ